MKRLLALLLSLLSLSLLAACAKNDDNSDNGLDNEFVEAAVTNPDYTRPAAIPIPEGSVKIRLPLSFLNNEQKSDLPGWADAHGVFSAEVDEKNGVAILTMSELSQKLLLTNIGLDVIETLYGILDDRTFPYFKSIETYDSKDFSELIILVDGNAYMMDADADLLPQMLARACMVYQGYTGESKYHCRVLVKDEASGGAVKDETYELTNKDLKE